MKLRTIRKPKPGREEIERDVREMEDLAGRVRAEAGALLMKPNPQWPLGSALRNLADYLEGNAVQDPYGDDFGITPPRRWSLAHAAYLVRTAAAILGREWDAGRTTETEHHRVTELLLALATAAMELDQARGARRTLDRLVRGELGE